jgi:glycosyltransferase involved in cell wall biosynthesis
VKVVALVLCHDEALQVQACLQSLAPADQIVVVDSGSADETVQLAAAVPRVKIVERPFANFADQRNHGLDFLVPPGSWVLHVDADERIPAALWSEIDRLSPPPAAVAYNLASRTFLRGRTVLRASAFPVYQTRLTRAGYFHFEQVGHGQKAPARYGDLPRLREPYDHFPFEKGFEFWRRRHETYARDEARDLRVGHAPSLLEATRNRISRRQWLKHKMGRLSLRPALVWAYLMIVRRGVLDGPAGWEYCRLRYLYERMVLRHIASCD